MFLIKYIIYCVLTKPLHSYNHPLPRSSRFEGFFLPPATPPSPETRDGGQTQSLPLVFLARGVFCHLPPLHCPKRETVVNHDPSLSRFERGGSFCHPPTLPHSKRETEVSHPPTLSRFKRGGFSATRHPSIARNARRWSTTTPPSRVSSEGAGFCHPPTLPRSKRETEVSHPPTLSRFKRGAVPATRQASLTKKRETEVSHDPPSRVSSEGAGFCHPPALPRLKHETEVMYL